ncbi:effector-binding domain-containing protein [Fulvimarina manganoxydans]|uniref:Effector-binding domain-containing protein n=1 Tax=Fulvimarina manganoxydans TaxID=937218 RepID=A0A1W2EVQ1_9HYPH|nr:heme-binding protein [Fulvimarina manganoxydans]SMD13642.1 effector-binding domain-containing protein [Fulvimarina manganoxydans]
MSRDRSALLDSLSESLQSIGTRLSELEGEVAERFDPRPSRTERVRRALVRANPFYHEPTFAARYLPDVFSGWHTPSRSDARRQLRALRDASEDGYDHARGSLAGLFDSLPDLRLPRPVSFRRGMKAQRGVDRLGEHNRELTALLVAGGAIAAVGAAYYVTKRIQDHAEEPDYEVVREDGAIEIRDYEAMIVAETVKSGYHEKARRLGFETLYDYIAAKTRSGKKIKMTTPVLQQLADDDGRTKGWAVRFVMPKKHTLASLPKPGRDDVKLKEMPARRMVAIRFSGNFNATLASKQLMSLYNYLADNNLTQKGDPQYAFYNPPWTPGFMKRNEILIEIER